MRRTDLRLSSFNRLLTKLSASPGLQAYALPMLDPRVATLPFSIRVLLESAIRNCDGFDVTEKHVELILNWASNIKQDPVEIPFKPARVLLQDFTGVPCVVDLAAMRDAMQHLGGDPNQINPKIPVELVVDHSVQVDAHASDDARDFNERRELERNRERFAFLKWGSTAFSNLKIVPPGSGIVHQVNLENLARVVFENPNKSFAYPDSVVGTDSHTTMINGLGVLGWGVGGIEAEAAMLGESLPLVLPKVVGYRLTGTLRDGVTATDLVLTVTESLRKLGVVGKFVEFHGPGLSRLSVEQRATLANMAPEYGATCGFFPIDQQTVDFVTKTGRQQGLGAKVEEFSKAAGLYANEEASSRIEYSEHMELDLSTVTPCVSGPKRPHDRVPLNQLKQDFAKSLTAPLGFKGFAVPEDKSKQSVTITLKNGEQCTLSHGSVVLAAITSCTNTSNPTLLVLAAMLARNAFKKGLEPSRLVKTSFSPGSHVAARYLSNAGLQDYLDALGFNVVGFGCMTCIGNSGEIDPEIVRAITDNGIVAAAVVSGNRNFEARIHPNTQANYLASPPLVVAYALSGRVDIDFETEPLQAGVFLRDIWPTDAEVNECLRIHVTSSVFQNVYKDLFSQNKAWNRLEAPSGNRFRWDSKSTYIHEPPYFRGMTRELPTRFTPIKDASCLLLFGDSVTTDHISPAGKIAPTSPAATFLEARTVRPADFNTYGSRRGNDLIMTRGAFANTRLTNKLVGKPGPKTRHIPSGHELSVFDAAVRYTTEGSPMVVIAGKEYGSGSSRDWAAKGPALMGVRAVIAESFERIHRSNLVGMGVLPLQFLEGTSAESLGLKGSELYTIELDLTTFKPQQKIQVLAKERTPNVGDSVATTKTFEVTVRIDTLVELEYMKNGGILQYVIRKKLGRTGNEEPTSDATTLAPSVVTPEPNAVEPASKVSPPAPSVITPVPSAVELASSKGAPVPSVAASKQTSPVVTCPLPKQRKLQKKTKTAGYKKPLRVAKKLGKLIHQKREREFKLIRKAVDRVNAAAKQKQNRPTKAQKRVELFRRKKVHLFIPSRSSDVIARAARGNKVTIYVKSPQTGSGARKHKTKPQVMKSVTTTINIK